MLIREQDRVRLISRGGHDWTRHFPLIVEAALKLRQKQFVLDGEVVARQGRRLQFRRAALSLPSTSKATAMFYSARADWYTPKKGKHTRGG
jgi:ATP-dependent DNA ligase